MRLTLRDHSMRCRFVPVLWVCLVFCLLCVGGGGSFLSKATADRSSPGVLSRVMQALPQEILPVRIKDIVDFEGVRENLLIGYGLVVGLSNTGDTTNSSPFTKESLVGMLERMGVNTRDQMASIKSKNVAAVIVTARLPPFSQQGTKIDVTVSAMGDAKSLNGGVLLVTPLLGADGEIYAVAQGSLATSSFSASGQSGTSITKGSPTNAEITNGAIVEREIPFVLRNMNSLRLSLKNPDFTTSSRISAAINGAIKDLGAQALGTYSEALDPKTVLVYLSAPYQRNPSLFLSKIETLYVAPDQVARVILDEKDGVIVMGEHVRISTVAVSQGNLTIQVTETPMISQPTAGSFGQTRETNQSEVTVSETGKQMRILSSGATFGDLVRGLNAFGVTPNDLAAILRNIKAAGAMHAELDIR